jgi:tetratricopeptide (TPR) repeat protein
MRDSSLSASQSYTATERNRHLGNTIPIAFILVVVLFVAPVWGQGDKWEKLMAAANSQVEKGQVSEAEKTYREALVVVEKNGNKYLRLPGTLIKLASVCEAQAKHDEADSLADRAILTLNSETNSYKNLKLDKTSKEEYYKIEITVEILESAASIYMAQKKYNDAEPLLKVVVTIREGVARKKKPKSNEDFFAFMVMAATGATEKVYKAYESLASFYFRQGNYVQANLLYERALSYLAVNSHEAARTAEARIHNMFGEFYFEQSKYVEAEASVEKALKIYQEQRAKPDPYAAIALSNLATFYVKQEKYYDNADSYFRQALNIFQKAGWQDQPEIADTLENYATLLAKLGKEADAREMATRAKDIRSKQAPSNAK